MSDVVSEHQNSVLEEMQQEPAPATDNVEPGPVTPPELTPTVKKEDEDGVKVEPTEMNVEVIGLDQQSATPEDEQPTGEFEPPIQTEEAADEPMEVGNHEPTAVAISDGELSSGGENETDEVVDKSNEAKLTRAEKKARRRHERRNRPRDPKPSDGDEANGGRKRKHSNELGNEEKKKLEKLKEMKFGNSKTTSEQDTRRFNFRQTAESRLPPTTPSTHLSADSPSKSKHPTSNGRGPRTPEPSFFTSDENAAPVLKTLRQLRSKPIITALDVVLSIPPEEMSVLNKAEMIEALEIMHDLNRKRELMTSNRRRLTGEARSICNTEITILNDLEHLMNPEEAAAFNQLRQFGPSMDEMVPFDISIDPADVMLSTGGICLQVVDLLPPSETPMIGTHDANWDPLLKHIPAELRGVPPPLKSVVQEMPIQQQHTLQPQLIQHVQQSQQLVFQQPPPQFAPSVVDQSGTPVFVQPPPQSNGVHQQYVSQQQPPTQNELPHNLTGDLNPPPQANAESGVQPSVSSVQLNVSQPMALDLSVPPPVIVSTNGPTDQQPPQHSAPEPLSPISAFRNSLKQTSLLNTLVPSFNQSTSQPPPMDFMTGPPPSMGNVIPAHLLQQPPPGHLSPRSMAPPPSHQSVSYVNAALSPNRFTSMPPPHASSGSRPVPLMSIEHPLGFIPRLFAPNKFQPSGPPPMQSAPPQHQRSRRGGLPSANFTPLASNGPYGVAAVSPTPSTSSTVATMGSEVPVSAKPPLADSADQLPDSAAELAAVTSTAPDGTIEAPTESPFEVPTDYSQSSAMETPPHVEEEAGAQMLEIAVPESLDELPINASAASLIVGPPSTVGPDLMPDLTTVASADSTTPLEREMD